MTGTLDEILAHVRRLLDVDASAFVVIDWDACHIRPAAAWFASDRVRAALGPVLERAYAPDRPGVTERAIDEGHAFLLESFSDWPGAARLAERLRQDLPPEQAQLTLDWYAVASVISAPVITNDGRTLGVLSVSSSPPHRPLDADALHLVGVLADLAAIALDREQLLESEARRRRQERLLAEASQAVAESLDPDVVLERVAGWAHHVTGATRVALVRARDREAEQRLSAEMRGARSSIRARLQIGPRLFGFLALGHEEPFFFDEARMEQVAAFARVAAGAIANAADHQHERRMVDALTRGFVPSEPTAIPGVEFAVRYEPAEDQPTGGDFYGAWPTGEGSVAIVVGDASGKGVDAAAFGSMARFFAEARTLGGSSPVEVLTETSTLLRSRLPEDALVTAFFALLSGEELRYANAGHPAPLIVRAGGGSTTLGGTGLPLGVEEEIPLLGRSERVLHGDVLVAFTDGLVEARRGSQVLGEEAVRRIASERGAAAGPAGLVDALVDGALAFSGRFRDDVTLLGLRRR